MLSLGEVLFKKDHYFDRANKQIAETIWQNTDKIYTTFYKANRKIVQIYFFSFFVIAVDIFSLFLALRFEYFETINENLMGWIFISPFIFEWLVSIIVLIVYKCRLKGVKRTVRSIVNENKSKIVCATKANIEELCTKIKLRSKYCKHNVFENWLKGIIIFFIPFILKLTSYTQSNFMEFFLVASSLFYIITFFSELVKFIKIKWKSKHNRLKYYKINYSSHSKLNEIEAVIEKTKTYLSEVVLDVLFFLGKLIIGFLFIVYFSQIGSKIDDKANGTSWIILFIPFYILYLPVICYVILHCCSLAVAFKNDLWKIIITIVPFISKLISNCIL